jgi:hypothetical protein
MFKGTALHKVLSNRKQNLWNAFTLKW